MTKRDKDRVPEHARRCYLIGLRILRGHQTRGSVAAEAGLSEPTVKKIETGKHVGLASLISYGRVVGLLSDALKGLRSGKLRPYVELRDDQGRKVPGFQAVDGGEEGHD